MVLEGPHAGFLIGISKIPHAGFLIGISKIPVVC